MELLNAGLTAVVSARCRPSAPGSSSRFLEERPGLQRVEVDLGDGPERAYGLTQLTGPVAVGDRVVVNTTAVELGLGTGGWHVIHWNLARDELERAGARARLKARYTSLQADVGSTEEHVATLAEVETSAGMPVVAAGLHSQLPAWPSPSRRPPPRPGWSTS